MSRKNELLKDLVDEWSSYTSGDRPLHLADFAEWLSDKYVASENRGLPATVEKEIERESLDNTVARYFGMLVQLSNVWIKITFKGTPFQGFEDYGITQFIMHSGTPTKSRVTERSTLERSTAFEVIRRMQRLELVEEFPDPNDKRTKRVKISPKGKAALKEADARVDQISRLMMGDLTENKKFDLLKLLLSLTQFHVKEYQKGTDEVEKNWFTGELL